MSIRVAKNKLTGREAYTPEVVLGYRTNGVPGVTVHLSYDNYGCFKDADRLEKLIEELKVGVEHLRGTAVS